MASTLRNKQQEKKADPEREKKETLEAAGLVDLHHKLDLTLESDQLAQRKALRVS